MVWKGQRRFTLEDRQKPHVGKGHNKVVYEGNLQ